MIKPVKVAVFCSSDKDPQEYRGKESKVCKRLVELTGIDIDYQGFDKWVWEWDAVDFVQHADVVLLDEEIDDSELIVKVKKTIERYNGALSVAFANPRVFRQIAVEQLSDEIHESNSEVKVFTLSNVRHWHFDVLRQLKTTDNWFSEEVITTIQKLHEVNVFVAHPGG